MGVMFDVGGTLAKAIVTLKMYKEAYGSVGLPEVSLSLNELRIRDPILRAEFIFYGEVERIDPIVFRVKGASLYKEPEVSPPLLINGRKVYFGASHDPKEIQSLVGDKLVVLYPRRDVRALKRYEGAKYYRRRFGRPKKRFSYDFLLMRGERKIKVKCLSARFGAVPDIFDKYPLKRSMDVDYIIALDVRKGILTTMKRAGNRAIVEDVVNVDVEVPSIASYLRALNLMVSRIVRRSRKGTEAKI